MNFRSFAVYLGAVRAGFQARLEYRGDLIIGVMTGFLLQGAALAFLWIVLDRLPGLQGWSGDQILLLFGITALVQGLSEMFLNNVWALPGLVTTGSLDRLLCLPVRSLPFLLVTSPSTHSIAPISLGGLIVLISLSRTGHPMALAFLVAIWALSGALIYTAVLAIVGSLSFRLVGPYGHIFYAIHFLHHSTRYPLSIYPPAYRALLLFFVPFGTINYIPAAWVFEKGPGVWAAVLPVVVALSLGWLALKVWEAGIRRYESTGS